MILNEAVIHQLTKSLEEKGIPFFEAQKIVTAFRDSALKTLEEGETLPLPIIRGYYLRKIKSEIEVYSKKT